MTNLAVSLSLYTATSLNAALELPVSFAHNAIDSKPFDNWKQGKESEMKVQSAIVGRLNEIIRALGVVAKTVVRAR